MHEADLEQSLVSNLIAKLGMEAGDSTRAYGEVGGSPVTLTVLGGDPLSLLFGFKIVSPHPEMVEFPQDLDALVCEGLAEASLEDGMAWLTFRDLSGQTSDTVRQMLTEFSESLAAASLLFPPGCISCGCVEDVEVVYGEGRVSRLCPTCAERVVSAKYEAEHQLNKPTAYHAFGLPVAFLAVAGGWFLFWFAIDLMMSTWKEQEIVVNELIIGVLIAMLGSVGLGLGLPLGLILRRSGISMGNPKVTTAVAVIPACLAGELLYIVAIVFWMAGFVDFLLAMQLFIPFVTGYSIAWIVGKIAVIFGVAVGCHVGLTSVKKVGVRL